MPVPRRDFFWQWPREGMRWFMWAHQGIGSRWIVWRVGPINYHVEIEEAKMSLNLGRPRNEIDPRRIVEKVRSLDDAAAEAMIRSVIACTKATDGSEKSNPENKAEWAFWEAMNHYSAKQTLAADDDNGVSQYCRDVMNGLAELWQAAKLHTYKM